LACASASAPEKKRLLKKEEKKNRKNKTKSGVDTAAAGRDSKSNDDALVQVDDDFCR
jgi:hypothetical protein